MGFAVALDDYMLDQAGTNKLLYISLHTADPGGTGANELTGGSPAYARKAASWSAAVSGAKNLASTLTFNVPAGSTVAFIGLWDALTGGNFQGGGPLATSETYGAQGTYTLTNPTSGGLVSVS
jgi:hypothetical protein